MCKTGDFTDNYDHYDSRNNNDGSVSVKVYNRKLLNNDDQKVYTKIYLQTTVEILRVNKKS